MFVVRLALPSSSIPLFLYLTLSLSLSLSHTLAISMSTGLNHNTRNHKYSAACIQSFNTQSIHASSAKCRPKNKHHSLLSLQIILSIATYHCRGVDHSTPQMSKRGAPLRPYLTDWLPDCVARTYSTSPPLVIAKCVTMNKLMHNAKTAKRNSYNSYTMSNCSGGRNNSHSIKLDSRVHLTVQKIRALGTHYQLH